MLSISGRFKERGDWRGQPPPPLLTECILKQVKIVHKNASLHQFFSNFFGRGEEAESLLKPHPLPFNPHSKILDPPLLSITGSESL